MQRAIFNTSKFIHVIFLPLLALDAFAQTDVPATIQVEDQIVLPEQRAPLTFKPFPMVDPITGKAIRPTDVITVAGKSLRAEDYFNQLNDYERQLNLQGFTLRNQKDIELVSKAKVDMGAILEAARIQSLVNIDFDPQIMEQVDQVKSVVDEVKKTALDYEDRVLRGFETLASSNDPNGFQARLTKLDEKVVKTPQLPALSGNTYKEWGFGPKDRDQVYINGKAIFHLGAEKTKAEGLATARMDGKILSQEFNLFYGHVQGNGDLALTKQDATGTLKAEVYFNSLGRERFKWDKSASITTKLPDLLPKDKPKSANPSPTTPTLTAPSGGSAASTAPTTATVSSDGVVAAGEETAVSQWLAVSRESLKLEPWNYSTAKSWIWYFSVGPVPGNGELGISGSAFVDWGSGINVSGARANLGFGANVAVWAKGAIGVEVLRAGVYGDMVLVESRFDFEGSAVFRLGDGALAGDLQEAAKTAFKEKLVLEPQVVSEIRGTRTLTFLRGSIGAFAEILVPKTSSPFWEPKRYTYELFNWDGYDKSGVIFSFKKVNSLGSYNVFGAQTKEDMQSATLDKDLDDHFNSILDDSGHESAVRRNDQLLGQQDEVINQFKVFVQSL